VGAGFPMRSCSKQREHDPEIMLKKEMVRWKRSIM
jgi:hypothetical protein